MSVDIMDGLRSYLYLYDVYVCVCVCAYFSRKNVPLSQICRPCYPSFGCYPCLGHQLALNSFDCGAVLAPFYSSSVALGGTYNLEAKGEKKRIQKPVTMKTFI